MNRKKILAGFFIGILSIMVIYDLILKPSISMYMKYGFAGVIAHLVVLSITIIILYNLFKVTDWALDVLFFNKKKKDVDFVIENDADLKVDISKRTEADDKIVRGYIKKEQK